MRLSGDLKGSAPVKLVGPKGEVVLEEGAIIAKRHLHLGIEKAKEWGYKQGDVIWVRVDTPDRTLVFGDTEIRLMEGDLAYMHIDTDEANAAGMPGAMNGCIFDITE